MGYFPIVVGLLGAWAWGLEAAHGVPRVSWEAARLGETAAFLGTRSIEERHWGGVSQPLQIGLSVSGRAWTAPMEVVASYQQVQGAAEDRRVDGSGFGAIRERVTTDVLIQEFGMGVQGGWSWWRLRSTLGGGGCVLRGRLQQMRTVDLVGIIDGQENTRSSISGIGPGAWLAATTAWRFGRSTLGLAARTTVGEVDMAGGARPAGGHQLGLLIAMRW